MTARAFDRVARWTARQMGQPSTFASAVALCVVWAATGPWFGFSDTWQLLINTPTTVLTFLAVFLLQSTQNHDTAALHAKIDELIRAQGGARDSMQRLEDLDGAEIERRRSEVW